MTQDHSNMFLQDNFKLFYSRVYDLLALKKKKAEKRKLEISAPFNFQHVTINLPGISPDEVAMLREQAAASRIGISDPDMLEDAAGLKMQPVVNILPNPSVEKSPRMI